VAIAIIGILFLIVAPFRRTATGAARRMQCSNNLKMIGLAMHNYELAYGSLPPAYTVDAEGHRLHSWRTLLLPFLEQTTLHGKIDFSKPWNDPLHDDVRDVPVSLFTCPDAKQRKGLTTYLAVVSPNSCLQPSKRVAFADIKDGLGNTVLVFEADAEQAVHWMSPADADPASFVSLSMQSTAAHSGGGNAVFADGSIRFLSRNMTKEIREAMVTTDGGELIGEAP